MREEMIATLATYFQKNGLMSKDEYRNKADVPYTWREIFKYFKTYDVMIFEVSKHTQATQIVNKVITKSPSIKASKTIKEEPIDE
jgi:hypothetical protein